MDWSASHRSGWLHYANGDAAAFTDIGPHPDADFDANGDIDADAHPQADPHSHD